MLASVPHETQRVASDQPGWTSQALLEHDLGSVLRELAALRRRVDLQAAQPYRRHRTEILRVLRGYEHARGLARSKDGPLRAVSWNIERGKRFDSVVATLQSDPNLRDADLVLLNEVDIGMSRSGNRNVARDLAATLRTDYLFSNSHLVLAQGDVAERAHAGPNGLSLHGNVLLSRLPIRRWDAVVVPEWRDRFHATEKRLGEKRALLVEVEHQGAPLAVVVSHLDPFAPPHHRATQMRRILASALAFSRAPMLLGGDLNTTTWDLGSPASVLLDVARKAVRQNIARTVDDYLWPERTTEQELFSALARSGFGVEGWNQRGTGTIAFDAKDPEIEAKVLEYMSPPVWRQLRKLVDPWDGFVPLHIDWFAGRQLRPLRSYMAPRPRESHARASDHAPIAVEFERAEAPRRR